MIISKALVWRVSRTITILERKKEVELLTLGHITIDLTKHEVLANGETYRLRSESSNFNLFGT
jgi:hypothetical protein